MKSISYQIEDEDVLPYLYGEEQQKGKYPVSYDNQLAARERGHTSTLDPVISLRKE
jgi:hypothetical protein